MLLWLSALTLFASATLLFWVQPMIAKMILPLLGGTPGVWNAAMVFFQAVLLGGYFYAHLLGKLPVRRQAAVHLALLAAAGALLPVHAASGWVPPENANPALWVLLLLAVSVGPPAFVVSTTAPLLQGWFARTGHRHAGDPYFLYSASNAGSLLALLGYPLLIEPSLRLAGQSQAWTAGYALLVVLVAACAALADRGERERAASAPAPAAPVPAPGTAAPATRKARRGKGVSAAGAASAASAPAEPPPPRWRWFALAAVPSSLLLGVTTHITTDVASIPLLWVIPLAAYLATFILAFARRQPLPHRFWVAAQPFVVLPLAVLFALRLDIAVASFPLHLAAFFVSALVCHGELARLRPRAERLTEFYLWLSLGGVAGGLFNALAAPLLFPRVWEYPIALVAACLLRPPGGEGWPRLPGRAADLALPAGIGLAAAGGLQLLARVGGLGDIGTGMAAVLGAAAVAVWLLLRRRPLGFGLGVAAVLLAGLATGGSRDELLFRARNFFGIIEITRSANGRFTVFTHGDTVHGAQSTEPAERREPLTYFTRTGPIGQVFAAAVGRDARPRVAVVGLGAGSLAAYGRPGQRMTFFEIDPDVERVARDPRLFTFLADSAAATDVIIGDARLTLGRQPDASFDLIVIDAFSSDAIPVHLITREALDLYAAKLAPRGIVAFNISNRYLDLELVLAALAEDRGWQLIARSDLAPSAADEIGRMRSRSTWAVMAPSLDRMGSLPFSGGWHISRPRGKVSPWTDDWSNIVGVFRFSQVLGGGGSAATPSPGSLPAAHPPVGGAR